jgi:NAD(P)-dependent dehydrogenase (short-subunit alcohol dehydrogenase family)
VTLITGDPKGVGAAVALQLAARGEAVVVNFSRHHAWADEPDNHLCPPRRTSPAFDDWGAVLA